MDAMFDIPSSKATTFEVDEDYTRKQLDKAHLQKLDSK